MSERIEFSTATGPKGRVRELDGSTHMGRGGGPAYVYAQLSVEADSLNVQLQDMDGQKVSFAHMDMLPMKLPLSAILGVLAKHYADQVALVSSPRPERIPNSEFDGQTLGCDK